MKLSDRGPIDRASSATPRFEADAAARERAFVALAQRNLVAMRGKLDRTLTVVEEALAALRDSEHLLERIERQLHWNPRV
ncbi:MAG TPA: hypothetical protein VFA57_09505 [Pseudolabrys sp.]|nr:hypothetical protein [Pseudolabrys sp.]